AAALGAGVGASGALASAVGCAAAGCAGSGAAGAALGSGAGVGAGAPGFGAAGRSAAGAGRAGLGAGAAGAAGVSCAAGASGSAVLAAGALGLTAFLGAGFSSEADGAGMASRRRRTTGASTVDEADLTNSPSSPSLARTVLLSTPSSLASSWTRSFATSLLSRPVPKQGRAVLVLGAHRWVLIGCPSASNPLSSLMTSAGQV